MKKILVTLIVLSILMTGCRATTTEEPAVTATIEPTSTLPAPNIHKTQAPDLEGVARQFLDRWNEGDYEGMYDLLSSESQAALNAEDFQNHYQDIAFEIALQGIEYQILNKSLSPTRGEVSYRITLQSGLVGDVSSQTKMALSLENGQWRIHWDDTLVLAELEGGNYLKMDRAGYTPERAMIYDQNGNPLMEGTTAVAVGIWPDNLDPEQSDTLYSGVSRLAGIHPTNLERMIENSLPGAYIPLGEYPIEEMDARGGRLYGLSGVQISEYDTNRLYLENGVAPHVVGYVGPINTEDVADYRRKGFLIGDMVGQRGIERWGEPYLTGKRGGVLYLRNAEHQPIEKLGEAVPEPSMPITTTLDMDLQLGAQQAIQDFEGAIVVLGRDTGRVLAMVSSPGFDPNAFAPGNYNGYAELSALSDPSQPLYDRATQGLYPLGSVAKIITMAAALESGRFTPESTYQCGYEFTELQGVTLYDWTYDHFLEDEETQPSGLLTLPQGLIRSCNPWFYHIGLDLFNAGLTTAFSDMARGFGLGAKTGIEGIEEQAGQVPDPKEPLDATNLATGQGDLQVTPLQVASFVAAVGNGGTLYRPQVIEQIGPAQTGGEPVFVFKPEARGELPVSRENLEVIRQAMVGVVNSRTPRGTAYHVFNGLNIALAGKTGTAQTGPGLEPHAWFAGYTNVGREDLPDIAVAVIAENRGEGSDFAAPIFRRIIELYFRGSPGKLYPWEETYNVEYIPTPEPPEGEATPTPEGQ